MLDGKLKSDKCATWFYWFFVDRGMSQNRLLLTPEKILTMKLYCSPPNNSDGIFPHRSPFVLRSFSVRSPFVLRSFSVHPPLILRSSSVQSPFNLRSSSVRESRNERRTIEESSEAKRRCIDYTSVLKRRGSEAQKGNQRYGNLTKL